MKKPAPQPLEVFSTSQPDIYEADPEKIKVDRVARPWLIRNAVYDALYRECKRRITKPAELARSTKTKGISMFEILSTIR